MLFSYFSIFVVVFLFLNNVGKIIYKNRIIVVTLGQAGLT